MKKYDLVEDIQQTDWMLDKLRTKPIYAQHLYAALCNTRWQHRDLWPQLADQQWSCSWRAAGGIVADLRAQGEDYMDFYCSGIGGMGSGDYYVQEGVVTQEIEQDLYSINWICSERDNLK